MDYKDFATEIEGTLDLREVVQYYGIELNHADEGVCPFHNEKTASFRVYESHYYCFGCHRHGSTVHFVMEFFGMSFGEAVKKLNSDFNLGLPIEHRMTLTERRIFERKKHQREKALAKRRAEIEANRAKYDELTKQLVDGDVVLITLAGMTSLDGINMEQAEALKRMSYAQYVMDSSEF